MQINITDSEISGSTNVSSHGQHSSKSSEMDTLMNNLTSGKPSHGLPSKNIIDGHSSSLSGAKKSDFFPGRK